MSKKNDLAVPPPPEGPEMYFWVVIMIAIIPIREVTIVDFPIKATSAQRACLLAQLIFSAGAYSEISKTWAIGGIPCEPLQFIAVPCPEYLHEAMEKKIQEYTAGVPPERDEITETRENNIIQLFPQKAPKTDDDIPPDDPPPPIK